MFDWRTDRVDELRRMCAEGYAASEMAKSIGTTRNAVIGKAKRLGLHLRAPLRVSPKQMVRAVAGKRPPPWQPPPQPPRPRPHMAPDLPLQCSPCTIADLTDDACHWPLWAEGTPFHDKRYCGAMAVPDAVYCGHHLLVSRQPKRWQG
jgi:GcrA cell cycle regulator